MATPFEKHSLEGKVISCKSQRAFVLRTQWLVHSHVPTYSNNTAEEWHNLDHQWVGPNDKENLNTVLC